MPVYPILIVNQLRKEVRKVAEIAKDNIKSSAEFAETLSDFITNILMAIGDYVEKHSEYAPQLELAKWIKEGNGVDIYPIQGKNYAAFKAELDKEKIPYLDIGSERELLIRNCDIEKCKEINRRALITELNYFQDVNAREMENAIAESPRITNKEMITLHGLSKYDVEVIKNKCNHISAGFMVGVEKASDGTYCLTVHSSKVYDTKTADENEKRHVTDFCMAYTQAMVSLYGPNGTTKVKQIDADEAIDIKIEELKKAKEVHYIIGVDDPSKFIEINGTDFQYYETSVNDEGKRVDRLVVRADVRDVNYDSELQRCLDRIYSKAILDNAEELSKHLSTRKRTVETDRPNRNYEQYLISIAESRMTNQIDAMIKEKFANENMAGSAIDKFHNYKNEVKKIFDGLETGEVPHGYQEEQFSKLALIMSDADVSVEDYKNTYNMLSLSNIEMHAAKRIEKEKLREVQKDYGIANR